MKRIALNALALLAIVGFVALGRWQLQREDFKRTQLAQAQAALAAGPVALATALATPGDGIARVRGDALLAATPVLWLDNQRHGARVGVRQYCLARVAGEPLLVDLGWLPLAADRALPEARCPQGSHALAGLLAPPPAVGLRLGPGLQEAAPGRWLATRIEPDAIAAVWSLPSLPARVLRLDPALPLGFERDLQMHANTLPPEKHRGYALQWFGLAATTLVIAVVLNVRRQP